ncbi:hypothetical protein P171DRAFT_446148 [Karstenula rhodostoma CBS 690.94]|uniref:Uncharacterized protein n=1 Tax=Karstenula rhodostoma CBS 690.94 TaxID=1392251 RepID=A0A9P4U9X6_9PLEO|nr:hypothetical protein P171DRAFT_446148 [Karstenula rhodostoma CBS 690.94]
MYYRTYYRLAKTNDTLSSPASALRQDSVPISAFQQAGRSDQGVAKKVAIEPPTTTTPDLAQRLTPVSSFSRAAWSDEEAKKLTTLPNDSQQGDHDAVADEPTLPRAPARWSDEDDKKLLRLRQGNGDGQVPFEEFLHEFPGRSLRAIQRRHDTLMPKIPSKPPEIDVDAIEDEALLSDDEQDENLEVLPLLPEEIASRVLCPNSDHLQAAPDRPTIVSIGSDGFSCNTGLIQPFLERVVSCDMVIRHNFIAYRNGNGPSLNETLLLLRYGLCWWKDYRSECILQELNGSLPPGSLQKIDELIAWWDEQQHRKDLRPPSYDSRPSLASSQQKPPCWTIVHGPVPELVDVDPVQPGQALDASMMSLRNIGTASWAPTGSDVFFTRLGELVEARPGYSSNTRGETSC